MTAGALGMEINDRQEEARTEQTEEKKTRDKPNDNSQYHDGDVVARDADVEGVRAAPALAQRAAAIDRAMIREHLEGRAPLLELHLADRRE
jgi:hypothetical protein